MSLYKYDKAFLEQKAKETGFVRDNLEKVYRLTDVLMYLNTNPNLSERLVLKGGTAINLTVFNMPRLSVDIDLDFNGNCNREEMLEARKIIGDNILAYMKANGYTQMADKSKTPHSLDSWVFAFTNSAGNNDNIKVEINYSMRNHVLPIRIADVDVDFLPNKFKVRTLAAQELFGSKIKALMERTAARDMYDVCNLIDFGVFDESEQEMLRKCAVFYHAVGSTKEFNELIGIKHFEQLTFNKVKRTLIPVIRKGEYFDLEATKKKVGDYITELMQITEPEQEFLHKFADGIYAPELLFDDDEILERIRNHPMAIWKTSQMNK